MLDFLEEAIRRQEASGLKAEVILLHPEIFRKVCFALFKLCPQLYPLPVGDKFIFKNKQVVKCKNISPGLGLVVSLNQAKKILAGLR